MRVDASAHRISAVDTVGGVTDQNPPSGPPASAPEGWQFPPAQPTPGQPAPQHQAPQFPAPQYQAPQYPAPQYQGQPAPQYPGYPQGQQYPAPGYPQAQQYPAPGYPAPSYPAPGYPQGQPYPYAAHPNGGTLSWALGFLVFAFPYVGAIAAGISMVSVRGAVERRSEVAAENARSAANWGLTFLLISIVFPVTHFILITAAPSEWRQAGFFPIGSVITAYFVIVLLHIVLTIIGTVRASGGSVMRVPFAIPFFRS